MSYQKKGGQRLRPLGTFLRDVTHIINYGKEGGDMLGGGGGWGSPNFNLAQQGSGYGVSSRL